MEYLYGTASSVTRDLVCVAVNELRYPCCFNNLVEDLQIEKDKLDETSNRVQQRIEHDKKQTIETDERVQTWLEEANTDIDNAEVLLKKARTNKSCCFGHCPNWIWRYSLGKQLSQRRRMIETRNTEGREHAYKQTERRASLPGLGYYFNSEKCLKFESRKNAYKQLMEALKSDQVNMIGMYGMGGCGKSTLAKEVGWRAKKEGLFDVVLYVSSTDQVQSIQEEIASQLDKFDLQEKGERQRAQRLHMRLILEEKLLVILDNVWEKLNFEAIGIPFPKNHKEWKVLITTRDQGVCSGMGCQRIILLPLLTDEEAWDLFQIQAQIITSDNLKHLARLISNECKGLAVLVSAVASTLKGKDEVEWKVALDRLKNSKPVDVERGPLDPYECLKLSYDNLDNKKAESIFLLCSVFPEEHEIPVEELTRFAIGLGLVGEVHSYDGARNEVCAAKEKLISSCLLLDPRIPGQGKCVKMHDLIRQVALRIAEDEGKGIKCALKKDVTMENTSLRYLWCEKFPYQLDWSNLEFLCLNTYDLEVLGETFKGMEKLRVLYLVNKGLERRPLLIKSFQSLTNLRCLLLEQWKLGDISFLGDLKKLESITLRRCSFSELPDILVTQLSSLRLLDLSECDMEMNLLQVIIGKHAQLEELYISDCRSEWDSYDEGTAEFFRKFTIPQALQRYHIQLGEYQEKLLSCCKTLFLSCFDTSNAAIKELAKKTEVLLIANIQGGGAKNIVPDIFQIDGGGMNELIELVISTSKGIMHLVDTGIHLRQVGTIFPKLCKLRIEDMEHLESLYNRRPPSGLFEKLEELYIEDCPELHGTLFVWKLNLCRLKVLELDQCPKLISLFTPAVAQSLAQLEILEVLYCGGLKYILEDDNQKKTSTNDHKLVFPKLKKVRVRGCSKLEYIIPVTFAHGLLQLECLKIEANPEMEYVFGQCNHDNQSHTELKINLPLLKKLTLVDLPKTINMCPKNYYPVWPSLHQFTLRNCPEVAIVSIDAYMVDLKGKQCDHSTTEIKKKWSLQKVRAIKKRELAGKFQLAGLSIDEEQDPLGVCLQKLTCTCNGLVQSMNLQNLEQMEVSGCREPKDEEHQNFLNFHLESNQLEDFPEITSIPSVVNYNSGLFNLSKLKRLILRSCSMLRTLFSPSTATHLTSLEELMITECHGLRYLVTHGNTIENEEEIIQEDHDLQIYAPMFPRLERISVMNCNLLEYIFNVSYAQGLVKLKDIEIWETPSLIYVFGRSIHDNDVHSSHQYQKKIQIELPTLEKVGLFNMPNMIDICPGNYHVTCSSLRLIIFMLNVGVSTLSVYNPVVYSGSTYLDHGSTSDILEASMTNVQVLGSVTVWNSSKIKGIFHHDKLAMNGQQAASLLIHLNLANLPELTYIWKGTKHSMTLQNLEYLYILGCQKLKVVFSCSVLRSLPQLKILAVLQCEGLEQIIEDDEKHENVSNPAITPKVCFSKLKLILVTQCNSLKRLFHLSAPHEFPELEYLVINQVPTLEEVFEAEQGMREGNIEVLLPKLSQVILMQLPNLNNISQGIEFETLTDLFVHNCPKLSLSSTTTVEDMLQICYDDWKIHLLVHSELLFIRDITNKEIAEKVLMLRTSSPEDQTASGSEQPSFQSIEDAIQENVQEGSPSEEPTKAALSAHTKPGGGDMLAQHSQVVEQGDKSNEEDIGTTPCQKIQNIDDSIQEGSSLLDKEGGTSVVSNDSIEAPLASVDTLGSHYLTMPKLGTLKDFADFDDVQLSLLGDAIAMYPHLWNVCEKFSKRFQAWMLKILADMLLFLRNKSPVNVTPQQEKEFHGLCVEAVQVGFDGSWVEEMQQRVLVRVPEVHYALARLNELHKNHDQLTRQLHEIKSEIDNLNAFVAAQEKCFDFL